MLREIRTDIPCMLDNLHDLLELDALKEKCDQIKPPEKVNDIAESEVDEDFEGLLQEPKMEEVME